MDESALKLISDVYAELEAKLKIHDVGTLKGKLLAYLKGVKSLLQLSLAKEIEGVPEKDQLMSLIK